MNYFQFVKKYVADNPSISYSEAIKSDHTKECYRKCYPKGTTKRPPKKKEKEVKKDGCNVVVNVNCADQGGAQRQGGNRTFVSRTPGGGPGDSNGYNPPPPNVPIQSPTADSFFPPDPTDEIDELKKKDADLRKRFIALSDSGYVDDDLQNRFKRLSGNVDDPVAPEPAAPPLDPTEDKFVKKGLLTKNQIIDIKRKAALPHVTTTVPKPMSDKAYNDLLLDAPDAPGQKRSPEMDQQLYLRSLPAIPDGDLSDEEGPPVSPKDANRLRLINHPGFTKNEVNAMGDDDVEKILSNIRKNGKVKKLMKIRPKVIRQKNNNTIVPPYAPPVNNTIPRNEYDDIRNDFLNRLKDRTDDSVRRVTTGINYRGIQDDVSNRVDSNADNRISQLEQIDEDYGNYGQDDNDNITAVNPYRNQNVDPLPTTYVPTTESDETRRSGNDLDQAAAHHEYSAYMHASNIFRDQANALWGRSKGAWDYLRGADEAAKNSARIAREKSSNRAKSAHKTIKNSKNFQSDLKTQKKKADDFKRTHARDKKANTDVASIANNALVAVPSRDLSSFSPDEQALILHSRGEKRNIEQLKVDKMDAAARRLLRTGLNPKKALRTTENNHIEKKLRTGEVKVPSSLLPDNDNLEPNENNQLVVAEEPQTKKVNNKRKAQVEEIKKEHVDKLVKAYSELTSEASVGRSPDRQAQIDGMLRDILSEYDDKESAHSQLNKLYKNALKDLGTSLQKAKDKDGNRIYRVIGLGLKRKSG